MQVPRAVAAILVFWLCVIAFGGCGREPTDPVVYESYDDVTFEEGEKPKVVIETNYGRMVVELWPDMAYVHCQNFVYLAHTNFYDSLTFHRVVPGFVIQGGDPLGNGTGGPGYTIPAEFSNKPYVEGTLGMARGSDINSAGSQFFVALARLSSLDSAYTVFGHLLEGYDVLHTIEHVPTESERPKTPVVMTSVYVAASD